MDRNKWMLESCWIMISRSSVRQQIMKPKKKKKLNIKKAIKKPGALRKSLGIKKGKTIPASVS